MHSTFVLHYDVLASLNTKGWGPDHLSSLGVRQEIIPPLQHNLQFTNFSCVSWVNAAGGQKSEAQISYRRKSLRVQMSGKENFMGVKEGGGVGGRGGGGRGRGGSLSMQYPLS